MFIDIGPPIADYTNAFVESLIVNYGNFFEAISTSLLTVLVALERGLRDSPPWLILLIVAVIAYAASRRLMLAAGLVILTWLIGCLGLWEQAMQTIAIMLVAVALSIVIGIPVGVFIARSNLARAAVNPILD